VIGGSILCVHKSVFASHGCPITTSNSLPPPHLIYPTPLFPPLPLLQVLWDFVQAISATIMFFLGDMVPPVGMAGLAWSLWGLGLIGLAILVARVTVRRKRNAAAAAQAAAEGGSEPRGDGRPGAAV